MKTEGRFELWVCAREPTIFWHLPGASLQQQPDPSASCLDEFNGAGVSHVPSAVSVNLYDLISYLKETRRGKGRITVSPVTES